MVSSSGLAYNGMIFFQIVREALPTSSLFSTCFVIMILYTFKHYLTDMATRSVKELEESLAVKSVECDAIRMENANLMVKLASQRDELNNLKEVLQGKGETLKDSNAKMCDKVTVKAIRLVDIFAKEDMDPTIDMERKSIKLNKCLDEVFVLKALVGRMEGNLEASETVPESEADHPTLEKKRSGGKFVCILCSLKFSKNYNLNSHMNELHNNQKKYSCHICQYKTNRKYNLNNHIKHRHGGGVKEFKCTMCEYQAFTKAKLKMHVKRVHEKIKDFQCKLCYKFFAEKQNVKNHMEVIHEREINMSLKASETVREVEADNPALEKKRVARWEN